MGNIFNEKDINKKIFDDRWVRFAFGPQGFINTDNFNLGIVEFPEDIKAKTHKHNVSEVLYVISGNGKIKIENNIFDIKEKDFAYIPKNTNHSITTDRGGKIKILFIFSGGITIKD